MKELVALPFEDDNHNMTASTCARQKIARQQALSSRRCEIQIYCGCIFIIVNCAHVKCRALYICECVYLFAVTLCLILF